MSLRLHPDLTALVTYAHRFINRSLPSAATSWTFTDHPESITSPRSALLAVTRLTTLTSPHTHTQFLGQGETQQLELSKWLNLAFTSSNASMTQTISVLNSTLEAQNFLMKGTVLPSLADIAMYWKVIPYFNVKSGQMTVNRDCVHVARWFDLLQNTLMAPLQPSIVTFSLEEAPETSDAGNSDKSEKTAEDNSKNTKENKKEKKKKEKKAKKIKVEEPVEDVPGLGKMDIRVGVIVKAWEHPDSEKLWCEEIDVGEDAPRQIASGLRAHFSLEEMTNRRCLVVCNLKPMKLAGFKSHGMVLCAKRAAGENEKKDTVEFVTPPESAKPGARVRVGGTDKDFPAATPNQVNKKKIWVNLVAPFLKTDADCKACFEGKPFTVDGDICKVDSVADAPIS